MDKKEAQAWALRVLADAVATQTEQVKQGGVIALTMIPNVRALLTLSAPKKPGNLKTASPVGTTVLIDALDTLRKAFCPEESSVIDTLRVEFTKLWGFEASPLS